MNKLLSIHTMDSTQQHKDPSASTPNHTDGSPERDGERKTPASGHKGAHTARPRPQGVQNGHTAYEQRSEQQLPFGVQLGVYVYRHVKLYITTCTNEKNKEKNNKICTQGILGTRQSRRQEGPSPTEREEAFPSHTCDKGLASRTLRQLFQPNGKKRTSDPTKVGKS